MAFASVESDCVSGKTAYRTGLDAGAAADWAMDKGMGDRWPYLCRHCDLWHVTSRAPGTPDHVDHHRSSR